MNKQYAAISSLALVVMIFASGCKRDLEFKLDNVISLGELKVSDKAVEANKDNYLLFQIEIIPGSGSDEFIALYIVDDAGTVLKTLDTMRDDGTAVNGDDIAGDNIYSKLVRVNIPESKIRVQAMAGLEIKVPSFQPGGKSSILPSRSTIVEISAFDPLTAQEWSEINNVHDNALGKLNEFTAGDSNLALDAISQLGSWISAQPGVTSAIIAPSKSHVTVKHSSGVESVIYFSELNNDGKIKTLGGGIGGAPDRSRKPTVPLSQQTRGRLDPPAGKSGDVSLAEDCAGINYVGNRKVMIYSPLGGLLESSASASIIETVNASPFKFEVTVRESNAGVMDVQTFVDYGLVYIEAHGWDGVGFLTNESVVPGQYEAWLDYGFIVLSKGYYLQFGNWVALNTKKYMVKYALIEHFATNKKFPNSIIFMNSCESSQPGGLSDAFLMNGARVFFGWSEMVHCVHAAGRAKEFIPKIVKEFKTIGEAFVPGQKDYWVPLQGAVAEFEMKYRKDPKDLKYPVDLVNGDFECGNNFGWNVEGDGRTISKLGYLSGLGSYTGIISTGLGNTTSTGKMYQSFLVKEDDAILAVWWNFLSEEFLEFIGSSYQDYFKISIINESGAEEVVFERNIDQLAGEHGASYEAGPPEVKIPGSLVEVSPGIKFDRGDVYMTGFSYVHISMSKYQKQIVTLVLEAGDVGDSVYDTAILIDDISIN